MDAGEEIQVMASLRRDSRSFWRHDDDVYKRSPRETKVDDEEALRWVALAKLPTCAINYPDPVGEDPQGVVDVTSLCPRKRRALLDRLVRVVDDDHERFLLKLKDRFERVGIDMPTIEVRFEHLEVEAEVRVGSSSLPTLVNYITNTLQEVATALRLVRTRKRTMPILHDVSSIIKPRRMTLLLGPPGSGKTTLLRALAGRLDKHLKVSGRVTYNGHSMDEFVPQRTAAYISQHDLHVAQMTVRETLAFSARCQGVGSRFAMLTELLRREKAANIKPDADVDAFMKASAAGGQQADVVTDYILKILGLEMCADILMGNDMIRGISGGQRKRVTTGEMLVGPAKALFMDEISTGLDSSTTYNVVNSLRHSIHVLGGTAIISLLQPAPETYNLFDDILLLSDGQIVYQGPRENVLEFFESVGFRCPVRKGVADFLQEVTSAKDQKQYWARTEEPYRFVPAKDFAAAFKSFHVGRTLANEIAVPFDKSKSHPAALTARRYGVTRKELLKANIAKEILLIKRNSFVYMYRVFQLALVSLITTTVFFRTKMKHDSVTSGDKYLGALFYGVLQILFVGFSELALTVSNLPVFFKHRDLLFYPAWAYTIPSWILKIPVTFVEVGVYVFLTYYFIGYDPNVSRFIKHYLLMMGVNQMATSVFRFIGGVTRDIVLSNSCAAFFTLGSMVLSGFLITRDKMKKWWIWDYWISPLMYAQNALSVNEMLGHSWDKLLNSTGSNETLGVQVLKSRGVFPEAKWYWIGFAALLGFTLLFNALFTLALSFLQQYAKGQQTISKEDLNGKHDDMKDEILDEKHLAFGTLHPKRSTKIGIQMSKNNSNSIQKGMVLPFVPLTLSFDNIRYSVTMPEEMKAQGVDERLHLVNGVSGSFRPGVLTALMGISGAGKTTLMDVLAGRKTSGRIEGNINISGYPKNQDTFARISGYCEQNDIHSPQVTVYESLHFSAWLRLPMDIDSKTRMMFIKEVMDLVELTPLKDSLVGLPGVNGLSTEQRKRLTIAVELVANPSIIFMDEPTSGLDARSAAIVMRAVRNTVDTGRTVVCTIHQPSIDIFEGFDELFLLKQGGEEIYVGPLGQQSSELIKYFQGIPGVCKIKDGYNPATWMMEVTAVSEEKILDVDFGEIYKKSNLYKRNKALIKELSQPSLGSTDLYFPTKHSKSSFTQFVACLWKHNLSYWRNPAYNSIRFIFTIVIALLLGTVYWDLGGKIEHPQDLFNAMGSMYGAALYIGISNCRSVQPVVSVERAVFYREKAAGMYSAVSYAFAQIVIEIPYTFVQATIYAVIVYAMMGFEWSSAKFFWNLYFMFFTLLYFTFFGMFTVSVTPNYSIASITCTTFYAIWNLFSGFIIPRPEIPIWWRWYSWLCPVAWSLYGLVVSQFGDVMTPMDDGTPVKVFVEDYFDFKHSWLGWVAAAVVAFSVLFAALFTLATMKLNFQRR